MLKFTRYGKLKNGSIVGNHTKLIGLKTACIGVTMKGEWILPKISDSFFDTECLTDNEIIGNINILQSSSIHNHIFLTKPEYRIVLNSKRKWGLILRDNADLNIKSILSLESNDLPNYAIIFTASNVRITGGTIIGDVGNHTYQDGTTSEWGFGILVNESENVTIKGMRITKCIGDGIYIGGGKSDDIGNYSMASKNISIKNIEIDDNRRLGISITCADGVYIANCNFTFPKEKKSFDLIQKNCTCSFNFTKCRVDTKGRTIETNN